MSEITTRAVFTQGVLKTVDTLNIPDGAMVEITIKTVSDLGSQQNLFARLAGVWQHLSDADIARLEQGLRDVRKQTATKMHSAAAILREETASYDDGIPD